MSRSMHVAVLLVLAGCSHPTAPTLGNHTAAAPTPIASACPLVMQFGPFERVRHELFPACPPLQFDTFRAWSCGGECARPCSLHRTTTSHDFTEPETTMQLTYESGNVAWPVKAPRIERDAHQRIVRVARSEEDAPYELRWNDDGELVELSVDYGNITERTRLRYDEAHRVVGEELFGDATLYRKVAYDYDGSKRLVDVRTTDGLPDWRTDVAYEYAPSGAIMKTTNVFGEREITSTYAYDDHGRPARFTTSEVRHYSDERTEDDGVTTVDYAYSCPAFGR